MKALTIALVRCGSSCVAAALLLLVAGRAGDAPPAPNTLTAAERAAGWRLLFDGHSPQGWRSFKKPGFPERGWVVEDGCLKHTARGGGGDLLTDETFDDFEFAFEWKLSAGANSGVKYFVTEQRASVLGHEYQLWDAGANAGANPKNRTASFYDVLPPTRVVPAPVGQFHSSRILVQGRHVEHWLNGEKVLEYELESEPVKAALARSKFKDVPGFGQKVRGHLLLQDHGGEVWFRNLKVRALTATP